jgi:hypothetical protein
MATLQLIFYEYVVKDYMLGSVLYTSCPANSYSRLYSPGRIYNTEFLEASP